MTDTVFADSSRFVISASSGGAYVEPVMTTLADGRIVASWHDGGVGSGNILHRIFDVDGTALTGEIISTTSTANDQSKPSIAALKNGGFVIVWEDNATDISAKDVRYRVFDANGVGGTVLSATAGESSTNWQTKPAVIGTADGGFVIAWTDENGTNSGLTDGDVALVARSFAAYGSAAGGIVRVSGPAATGEDVAIESSAEGVVFVWDDNQQNGIYTLTVEGAKVPDIDRTEDGTEVVGSSEFHQEPDVAITSAGTVFVWTDGSAKSVFYRIGSGEVTDLHASGKTQSNVRVDALPFGGFVVTWNENNDGSPFTRDDVMVRVFDSTGAPIGAAQNLSSSSGFEREFEPEVTALIDGRFMLSWVSDGTNDIYGQIFDSRTAVVTWTGGALGERFVGTDIVGAGDVLDGAGGNDRILGQKGNDKISGGHGNDLLDGGEGNDLIDGGAGTDRLIGGLGNDTFVTDGNDVIVEQANGGTDTVRTTANLTLADNIENLQIISTTGRSVSGNSGNNTLTGGNGDDRINGGGGADRLIGGLGNDTYITDGSDVIVEQANGGSDTVLTTGNLTLGGNIENLQIIGNTGRSVSGNSGDNTLTGGNGDDRIDGGGGTDRLIGGKGDDTYVTNGDDTIIEAASQGRDTVRSSVTFTLGANVEALVLTGSAAISGTGNGLANAIDGNGAANNLSGLGGDDDLFGGSGNDRMDGGAGNDRLRGGTGKDSLTGGAGNDRLNGGGGIDSLTGGAGADSFVFDQTPGAAHRDTITDYNVAADTILLDNADFRGLAAGKLNAGAFVRNASGNAADVDDRIIYETDTGKLFFDRDGSGSAAKVHFATLDANLGLTNADFLVF